MTDASLSKDAAPPLGLVLRYDGECAFCRHEVERLARLSGGRVRCEPLQSAAQGGVTSVQIELHAPDGRVYGGAEAVFRALAQRPIFRPLLGLYLVPGLRQTADAVYRWVAANRYRFSAVACRDGVCGRHFRDGVAAPDLGAPRLDDRPTFRRSTKLFLVVLGLLHLAAFGGLYPQVLTLMGREGLIPVTEVLENVRAAVPERHYRVFPTLFWLNSSDGALRGGCLAGIALSLCVVAGVMRRTALFLLGALYLSFVVAGTTFFSFQWDNLLIETTLHALLLPSYSRPLVRRGRAAALRWRIPHPSAIFLMHWLLFRVYFESGVAKLQALGGGWRDLAAMKFYYDTAPLATWLGWYAHNLPSWWHEWETALTLLVEVLLSVFIFSSRRWRRPLFVIFSGFQLAILLTANYGLFNYITLALGLFLLEDRDYEPIFRVGRRIGRWRRRPMLRPAVEGGTVYAPALFHSCALGKSALLFVAVVAIVAASLLEFFFLVSDRGTRPLLHNWRDTYQPFRLVNTYHLFASMTRERVVPEIQGLSEGGEWVPYRWRFAPADPKDAPRFAAPYHPRLDFQIWFVALSRPVERPPAYFVNLLKILSEHPERAAEFFASDPFAGSAPRMLRAMLYRYRMTDPPTRSRDGTWWRREDAGRLTRDIPCTPARSVEPGGGGPASVPTPTTRP